MHLAINNRHDGSLQHAQDGQTSQRHRLSTHLTLSFPYRLLRQGGPAKAPVFRTNGAFVQQKGRGSTVAGAAGLASNLFHPFHPLVRFVFLFRSFERSSAGLMVTVKISYPALSRNSLRGGATSATRSHATDLGPRALQRCTPTVPTQISQCLEQCLSRHVPRHVAGPEEQVADKRSSSTCKPWILRVQNLSWLSQWLLDAPELQPCLPTARCHNNLDPKALLWTARSQCECLLAASGQLRCRTLQLDLSEFCLSQHPNGLIEQVCASILLWEHE